MNHALRFRRRHPWWRWIMLACLLGGLLLSACGNSIQGTPIRVASAESPEAQLLGQLVLIMLQEQGYPVIDRLNMRNSQTVRQALSAGSIDICWAYTADTWTDHLDHDVPIASPALLYQRVRDEDALNGITWLSPTSYERRLGLLMTPKRAGELGLGSLSELGAYVRGRDVNLSLCTPERWYAVSSGIRGLERVYNFQFRQDRVTLVDDADRYRQADEGVCDCVLGYIRESQLMGHDLQMLEDDRGFFMPTNLSLGVRTSVLREYVDLEQRLLRLSGTLDQETMVALTRQVLLQGEDPARVARRFLKQRKLIGPPAAETSMPKPTPAQQPLAGETPPAGADSASQP